jgi:lipopolysaccharide biosynthesis glycosyltransferase
MLNVLYGSSDYYAHITGISIVSLFENNKDIDRIRVFLVDYGISDKNKTLLLEISERYRREIIFINENPEFIKESTVGFLPVSKKWFGFWGVSCLCFLPDDIEYLLFLDSDIVITDSVRDLFKIDMENKLVAGVISPWQNELVSLLDYSSDEYAINLGVLYFNLKLARKQNIIADFCREIANRSKIDVALHPSFVDGVFGKIVKNQFKPLHCSYNLTSEVTRTLTLYKKNCHIDFVFRDIGMREEEFDDYRDAIKKPVIIHYVGSNECGRPWEKHCTHPLRKFYERYKDLSLWNNVPYYSTSAKPLSVLLYRIERFLPEDMAFYFRYKLLREVVGKKLVWLKRILLKINFAK